MTSKTREEWRPVPGYDRYEVSTLGRVRNVRTGRVLRPQPHRRVHPYLRVDLAGRRRDGRKHYVHRLVLLAFVGPPAENQEALHRDDNPLNNTLSNLYWGPVSVNRYNRTSFGRRPACSEDEEVPF